MAAMGTEKILKMKLKRFREKVSRQPDPLFQRNGLQMNSKCSASIVCNHTAELVIPVVMRSSVAK
jgi:hypothetical protein